MEQYLILLFVLFSIVSALLERRKRARQLEEARLAREARLERERQQGGLSRPEPEPEEEEEEEEEAWPFPMGGDPFEPFDPRQPQGRAPQGAPVPVEDAEPMPPLQARGRSLVEVLERQAQQAEERARRDEERAREMARQASQPSQPRQRVQELVRRRMEQDQAGPQRRRKGCGKWALDARAARDAMVYAEILGRPKAERTEELWS